MSDSNIPAIVSNVSRKFRAKPFINDGKNGKFLSFAVTRSYPTAKDDNGKPTEWGEDKMNVTAGLESAALRDLADQMAALESKFTASQEKERAEARATKQSGGSEVNW